MESLNTTGDSEFRTTRWTLVLTAAKARQSGHGRQPAAQALEELCRLYRSPVYEFVKWFRGDDRDAEDLTQGFFLQLLEKGHLVSADPARGRFRDFLKTAVKNFILNERKRAKAKKRGGGRTMYSLESDDGKGLPGLVAADYETPERLFDRNWALAVLEQVRRQLQKTYADRGAGELCVAIQPCLAHDPSAPTHAEIAKAQGKTEDAITSAIFRLRREFRERLREEVAQTVDSPGEIDAEIAHLIQCVSRDVRSF